MKKVLAFGAFDPLHEGHKDFLRQARELGDHLTVVVAHDSAIRAHKRREPYQSEEERLAAVKAIPSVDEVILGRKTADQYHLLGEIEFDVLALGYEQKPSDEDVRTHLNEKGKHHVTIVRLKPYQSEKYPPT
ncbi:MAG: adenylyltransferase/cytidyltransferase family protein [Patescibacteria group bacterium]